MKLIGVCTVADYVSYCAIEAECMDNLLLNGGWHCVSTQASKCSAISFPFPPASPWALRLLVLANLVDGLNPSIVPSL